MGRSTIQPGPTREAEELFWNEGRSMVAGLDEVGRGALAGPVVAASVILPHDFELPGITDSKRLSEAKREELYPSIIEGAVAWSIGVVCNVDIDRINIRQATLRAMELAVGDLSHRPDALLIDGNDAPSFDGIQQTFSVRTIVKGDLRSTAIAAASIVAKVTRDRMMCAFGDDYPDYGFHQHKGYGTELHRNALASHGLTPIHRETFLGSFMQQRLPL